ncbi:hypothetical protein BC628DRAFT_182627 [Trametes gibbosa]|nr:hypothetical protein BC628DRAFT_182627 [Trametes gibbosa]
MPDVLSAVNLAQHQLAKTATFGGFSRALTSTVINLVETCLREACPRVSVLEDVRFALSRPAFPCHDPLLRFLPRYSTATFAFTLLSGDKAEHESESPSEPGSAAKVATLTNYLNGSDDSRDTESSSSKLSSSGFSSDYDWTFEKFEEINERRERARLERLEDQTISSHYGGSTRASKEQEAAQVPETELLAHQGTSKLCVLVIAPPHRIAPALQSAVYHRRACGISQPVVGLIVSPESPTIRLAVAWPEDTNMIDGDLPDVHIAVSASGAPGTYCLSIAYDMCNVGSALLLAASVLSLKRKLDSETAAVRVDSTIADYLSWRADRLRHAEEPEARNIDDSSNASEKAEIIRPQGPQTSFVATSRYRIYRGGDACGYRRSAGLRSNLWGE